MVKGLEMHPLAPSFSISIILPVRNEGVLLRNALDAVLAQDYSGSIEILIADGMSSDNTREIIKEYQERHRNIYLIDNPGMIVPTGMNAALRRAHGEMIVRVDGHCIIAADYVSRCVAHLSEESADGVGGPMETIGETPLAETIAVAMSSIFGVGNSAFRTQKGRTQYVDTVPFPAYTRAIIDKVGLYDEELVRNQDDEYNYRIREKNGKILLAADVTSKYYSRGSLSKLGKQYYQYGFYKVRVLQKHPAQMSLRQFVPPLFVFGLAAACLGALFSFYGVVLLEMIVGFYFVANLVACLFISTKSGWRHFLMLPFIFSILHLSYGLGFWGGLLYYVNRWGDRRGKVPPSTIPG